MKKIFAAIFILFCVSFSNAQISFFGGYAIKDESAMYPIGFGNDESFEQHTQISAGSSYQFNRYFALSNQLRYMHKRGMDARYSTSSYSGGGSSPYNSHSKMYTASYYADLIAFRVEPTLTLARNNIFGTKSKISFGYYVQIDLPLHQKEIKGAVFEFKTHETYPGVYQNWDSVYKSNQSLIKISPAIFTGLSIAQNWYMKNCYFQIQYSAFACIFGRYKPLMPTNSSYGNEISYIPYINTNPNNHKLKFGSEVALIFGWTDINNKIIKKKPQSQ